MKKIFIILAAAVMLAASIAPAPAQEMLPPDPNVAGDFTSEYMGERILVDVFILRPIGFAATVLGLAGSIPAYPFASMSYSTDRVDRELVQKPWAYTFCRPVGDIDF